MWRVLDSKKYHLRKCISIKYLLKNDGIVCITSIPEILNNKIIKNKSNGIMILKDSRPRIIANLITENDGIGLFVRDKSNGVVQKNIVPLQNNIYIYR